MSKKITQADQALASADFAKKLQTGRFLKTSVAFCDFD
jgi:hypothetical protein